LLCYFQDKFYSGHSGISSEVPSMEILISFVYTLSGREGNYRQPVFRSRKDVKNVMFQKILEKAAITAGQAYALGQGLG
jgi:hypothetical protein